MKAKVNLVEDKSKRKFMNPKGKKFKILIIFILLPMKTLLLSNLLNLPPSNPKPLARRKIEDFFTSAEELMTWCLNISIKRRNQSKLNQEKQRK